MPISSFQSIHQAHENLLKGKRSDVTVSIVLKQKISFSSAKFHRIVAAPFQLPTLSQSCRPLGGSNGVPHMYWPRQNHLDQAFPKTDHHRSRVRPCCTQGCCRYFPRLLEVVEGHLSVAVRSLARANLLSRAAQGSLSGSRNKKQK